MLSPERVAACLVAGIACSALSCDGWSTEAADEAGETRLVKILAIDGGGARGIIPAIVLAEIERRTGRPVVHWSGSTGSCRFGRRGRRT